VLVFSVSAAVVLKDHGGVCRGLDPLFVASSCHRLGVEVLSKLLECWSEVTDAKPITLYGTVMQGIASFDGSNASLRHSAYK
jgi:hypothetical protein